MSKMIAFAIAHGLRFVGKPYIWGGQGPIGLDCSGLMVEILRAVGVLARKFDTTAQGLYDRFPRVQGVVKPGDLVFFGTDTDHITHVGMCVEILENSEVLVLEAAGGRRGMDEPEEAQANGAMVTVRPLRGDYVGAVRPWR